MEDRKVKSIFEAHGGLFQQRSRTADESFETLESVRRKVFTRIEEKFEQCGNDADAGDMVRVQFPPKSIALEFPIQDRAALAIEGGDKRNHDSVHMMDRKHAHQAIVQAKVMPVGDRIGVDQEISHREDYPLG